MIYDLSLEESEIFNKTNRIEQWWSNEESRIMAELRNIVVHPSRPTI
ncbi:14527_t:CDS:2, partial [Racocetra persica]